MKVQIVKDWKGWKKGTELDIEDDQQALFTQLTPQEVYKVLEGEAKPKTKSKKSSSEEPEGEPAEVTETTMGDVHTEGGVIMETDQTYNITVLDHRIKEYKYKSEDDHEFTRYELPIIYDEEQTTIRLPKSVIEQMWKDIKKNQAVPVSEKHPMFSLRKTGSGIKTKYSVIYQGVAK